MIHGCSAGAGADENIDWHGLRIFRSSVLPPGPFAVGPQPRRVCGLIERARRKAQNRLGCVLLACNESEAVEFQEQDTDYKSRSLVAIDKGMVADKAAGIKGSDLDHVRGVGISVVLEGARQSGLQKPFIAQSWGTAMVGQKPVVNREGVALFDPDRLVSFHFARARSVLR